MNIVVSGAALAFRGFLGLFLALTISVWGLVVPSWAAPAVPVGSSLAMGAEQAVLGAPAASVHSRSVVVPQSVLPARTGMSAAIQPSRSLQTLIAPMTVADPVVTDPSIYTVSLAMQVDTRVHLTATVAPALTTGSGYYVEIHDLAAPAENSEVWRCSNGSTCSYTTTPEFAATRYVAVVTPTNSTKAAPTVINAVSEIHTPPPWTVSIVPTVTTTISITATTNYALNQPARYLSVSDLSTGGAAGTSWCSTGTTCVRGGFAPKNANSSYAAFVSNYPTSGTPACSCYQLAVSGTFVPPPWQVTLEGSGSTLTARGNYDVGAAGRYFEIFDLSKKQTYISYVGWCSTGTSCTLTTSNPGHQFIATVGTISNNFPPGPMFAASNQMGLQGPTATYEAAGGSNPAELNDCFSCVGDPINTSNGEFFETATDLAVPGRGPALAASRTYSSQRHALDGPFGFGWSSPYSLKVIQQPDGSVQVHQENGSRVTFTPTGTGTYTAPSHVLATLQANIDGTWTYTRKSREIFTFAQAGHLASTADLNGNSVSLGYDAQGRLSTATDAAGRVLTFAYGANGRISSITDPANRASAYTYDAAGRLETVTLPGNRVTTYTYDAGNLLTSMTDPRGSATVNTYDLARRVIKQTTAAGDLLLSYGYEGANGQTTITSPGGRITKETYTAGQMIKRIAGAGTAQQATWTYAYDQTTFARSTVTDPLNRTTTATYDAQGNKLTATDAGGGQASATYGALNNMLTGTDAAGTTTTFTYDAAGNRLTASRPLTGTAQTAVVTNTYGDTEHPGDITSVTDPNGNATTFVYDTYGNRTSITDALGRTTATAYDILGRKTSTTTPSGKTTTFAYNTAGFLETVADPLGKVSTFAYDAAGNKTSATDPLGHTTTYTFDALGRHTGTTAADNTTTSSGYDNDGNLTSQTDQNAHTTSYTYDSRNRLTSSKDGLNRTTTYAYDAAGQLKSKTDPSARTTTISYNTAGDKTGISYSDGVTPNETFTYTALHQPSTMTDGTGTTTMSYDSLGRLTSRTNGAGKNISFAYDLAGNITAQTYPNGQTVTRTYDTANNLTSITDWLNNTTTFTTTADSQPATTAYANGVTATTTYDNAGRTTDITAATATTTLATFTYTRNDNGNLASATTTGITQPAESYGYTDRDQLATINTTGYSYDPSGNPTTMVDGATLAYDAANQPTQHTLGGTTTPITYDNQGNRLTGPAPTTGNSTYTWNQANRLKTANGTAFTYSADSLRASRTPATGPAQTYTWDTTRTIPLMLTDGAISYIYDAAGNPVEHIDANGTVHYYQQDQYGSTRLLTDGTGSVLATYTFDPYGNLTQKTGTADTLLRWNGQAQDAETGLYYLRARYYDPATAQFLSVDPLVSATRDIYTYANNNPLNQSDPLGLMADSLGSHTPKAAADCESLMTLSPEEESYGPSFIVSLPVATLCVIWCIGASLNFAHGGLYFGWTTGIGARAEASIGASVGVGKTLGNDNMSVECAGLYGGGLFGGVSLPPNGSGDLGITGAHLGAGFGLGAGCSMMWTDYTKLV